MIALLLVVAGQLEVPSSWTCEPSRFADGICDCGCDAVDDDCSEDIACVRDNCADGTSVSDDGVVCVDDDVAEEDEDEGGCGGGGGAAAVIALPLVRRRRR